MQTLPTLREAGISLAGMRPRFAPVRNEGNLRNPGEDFLASIWGGFGPLAAKVTTISALGLSTVYACVDYLASILGTLPLDLYVRTEAGRKAATSHAARMVMTLRPNREHTPSDVRCTLAYNYFLFGNAYLQLVFNRGGEIAEVWPRRTQDVTLMRRNGFPAYRVVTAEGGQEIGFDRMLHLRGMTFDGFRGMGPMGLAKNLIGLAQTLEDNSARFFANSSRPGMIYTAAAGAGIPGLTEPQRASMKEQLSAIHQGVENAYKTIVLEGGGKIEYARTNNDQSQFDEIARRTNQQICQFFGVPPHKVGILDNATFSNIEQQQIQAVQDKFLPLCVRWEQAFGGALLTLKERQTMEFKHDLNGLMRGDSAAKSASYVAGLNNGYYTVNDVRRWEELPPVEGGDVPYRPLNMTPLNAPAVPLEQKKNAA